MSILSKAIYKFNSIPNKIPMVYFTGLEQLFQKYIWDHKIPQIAIEIVKKKNKVGGITLSDIQLYYKAIVSKQHVTGIKQTYRLMKQNKEPKINPCLFDQLIFDKESENIQ